MKKIIISSLFCGFIAACGGSYFDNNIPTKYPEGLELYVSKCGGCHRLYNRDEFPAEKWGMILIPMQKKSRTSDEEVDKIFDFLTERDSALSGPVKILSGN